MKVKIINLSGKNLPEYSTDNSAGLDLFCNIDNNIVIPAGGREIIPTGLYIEIPEGFEAQIRPRSGLAIKNGITVLNSPGTIDADYRGEIRIILINHSGIDFEVKDGDRICQMVFSRYERVEWVPVDELNSTERGKGGFGHTGI